MTRLHDHDRRRLEDELRRDRPQPPRALEDFVTAYLAREPRRRRLPLRALVVAVLTAGMLGGVGTTVGAGHAAAGPAALVTAVVHVIEASAPTTPRPRTSAPASQTTTTPSAPTAQDQDAEDDPSDDQYKPGKGCGDKNHVHARVNECK